MKILLAVGRDPWPARRGDQLRANQFLEALSGSHQVTVLAPDGQADEPPRSVDVVRFRPSPIDRVRGVVNAAVSGLPLQAGLFASRDLERRLIELAGSVDVAIVQLARLERAVRVLGTGAVRVPVLVDLIDALSLGVASRARVDRPFRRPVLRWEASRLARLERRLVERTAGAIVVAPRDLEAIARDREDLRRRLSVVPLAKRPSPGRERRPEGAPQVVLTGNLGYFVNRDAVLWVLREVWPALRSARPDALLVIAGARPDAALRRTAARAGARLLADPPSLEDVLARAAVSLAPMRCGSGTPVKVLEAWAAGTPVVASPYAAAGTVAGAGRELLVAEDPADWVAAILRVLADADEADRLAAAGRRALEREHSPARVAETLEAALAGAMRRGAGAVGSSAGGL